MIGKKFGRYEVLARLGAGGMGEVYRAKDLDLGRSVALKLLPQASQTDPDKLHRFEHEARAASALNHPNIVTIYEIGYEDGVPFISMELVEGSTLRALLGRRPFLNKRALALAAQATEGLAKAHAAGIVHRDLKPENLMVTPDGFVKILDFGLAKLLNDSGAFSTESSPTSPATRPGVVMGTVGYMSPEQARGKPLDFRSDQFACGAILYEMATGRRAFDRETPIQTLAAIIDAEPEPIQNINPNVPAPFRWVVERCLKKNPDDRYASTLDLARELRNVHDRLEEVSGSGSGSGRTVPIDSMRRSSWFGPVGVAALLAVAVAAIGLVRGPGASAAPRLNEAVAILPLRSLTAGDETLGIAMTDAVTTKLSEIPSLTVVDRTAVREFRDKADDLGQAARELGADFIVTGGVQRADKLLSVTVRLIKPDNTVSWAQQFEGTTEDLFGLQRQVALGLSSALRLRLTLQDRRRIATPPTSNPEAYADYLQGRAFLERPDVPENIDRAIAIFERAIAKDAQFALAHAGLGEAFWEKYRATRDASWTGRASTAILEALRLTPDQPDIHISLAVVYQGSGKLDAAIRELQAVVTQQPSNDHARRLFAEALALQGQIEPAVSEIEKAIAIRPSFWRHYSVLGNLLLRRGSYPQAIAAFKRVTELQPDSAWGYQQMGTAQQLAGDLDKALESYSRSIHQKPNGRSYSNMGKIFYDRGQLREAIDAFEQGARLEPTPIKYRNLGEAYEKNNQPARARDAYLRSIQIANEFLAVNPADARELSTLAVVEARFGRKGEALAHAEQAATIVPTDGEVLYRLAVVQALLGRSEEALRTLDRALGQGYSRALARADENLAPLRGRAEFDRLVNQPEEKKRGGI